MIPVILGPKGRHYVIDHHHLARALHDEGVKDVLVNVIADLSALDKDSFWVVMDCRGWCHPYDAAGVRQDFADIPASIADLVDDPFRSLAGELRRAGGFAKDTTPFSEFIWADFLRRRIKRKAVEKDFELRSESGAYTGEGPERRLFAGLVRTRRPLALRLFPTAIPSARLAVDTALPIFSRRRPMERRMRKEKTKNQILANRRKGHHKARNRRRRARAKG